ncbi:MAG: hypothetical protein Ta2C_01130 [Candidatus Endomicrobiellum trichonymphae]|uniref:type II restriction enzyme n=1 Tax=Endomicrobium trichonymphae TaxID=1408204 RepID=UPI0027D39453|nr:MAG: hypothetical protein Ta2C_01130 [Candidatus Endomicrobium trichonymphae]
MTKKQIIEKIFDRCIKSNNFVFDNNLVKNVIKECNSNTNPYDMTKIDDISKLPETVIKDDYCIVHLGSGKHEFIKGISKVYHTFEKIENNETVDWIYIPSILNDFSTSESGILSLANNQRILHEFLYQDYDVGVVPDEIKMYGSERKRGVCFEYFVSDKKFKFEKLQIEIDLTLENTGYVTVFEGKNSKPKLWTENFNVYQLYNPFRYYYDLKEDKKLNIKKLTACYLVRQKNKSNSIIRLYNYTFEKPHDITSIKLLKKKEYRLKKERV